MVLPFVTPSEMIVILTRVYIILQFRALSTHEHRCPIDDARAVHRIFLLARRRVYRVAQSRRYQAAFAFLRLWRWSLLPVLPDS